MSKGTIPQSKKKSNFIYLKNNYLGKKYSVSVESVKRFNILENIVEASKSFLKLYGCI